MITFDQNTKVLIVGLGVIGGGYAKALSKRGCHVKCITLDQKDIDYAKDLGIIEYGTTELGPHWGNLKSLPGSPFAAAQNPRFSSRNFASYHRWESGFLREVPAGRAPPEARVNGFSYIPLFCLFYRLNDQTALYRL